MRTAFNVTGSERKRLVQAVERDLSNCEGELFDRLRQHTVPAGRSDGAATQSQGGQINE